MDHDTAAIGGIRTVAVPVTDQDRALAFYVDLGLEVRMDAPVAQLGGRWIEVAPPGAAVTLALVPAGEGAPSGVPTGIRLTSADVPALHERLRAAGAEVEDLLAWPGVPPMFTLHDPDGNRLQVVQDS